jgi:hypothetical protein
MELDELKQQLNQQIAATRQERSVPEIAALLKKDAASVIQKIKRSLRIELLLTVVFTTGCALAVAFIDRWAYATFLTGFGLLGLMVSAALFYLLWKTNKPGSSALTVRNNLETIISIIRQYTWLYLRLGMGLLPLSFGLAFWLSYNDPSAVSKPIRWDIFAYMLAALFALGYGSFRFTKWYLRKLYGHYVAQLEAMLKEFNED